MLTVIFYFMREHVLQEILDITEVEPYIALCTWFSGYGFLVGVPIAGMGALSLNHFIVLNIELQVKRP